MQLRLFPRWEFLGLVGLVRTSKARTSELHAGDLTPRASGTPARERLPTGDTAWEPGLPSMES